MTNAVVPLRRPLDRRVTFTHFPNLSGESKSERTLRRFRDLVQVIEQTQATKKARLPLLSFVRFGNIRSPKGSLRHDANVLSVGAVAGDHDAGTMTLEEAEDLLSAADIAAVLHTTASHTPDKPRWHVFCPTAGELPPEGYKALVARLNGVLRGALKGESFTLSQSYYYGHIQGAAYPTAVVDGLRTIDEAGELDAGAIWPAKERDDTRSGDAARLAHKIKVVNRETYTDFCEAVDADAELSQWREDNRRKYGNDRQMSRTWNLVKAPPEYDNFFDIWHDERKFRLTRFTDIKLDTKRRYIVRGLIPREGLVVVWGPPKCGKSFWISDLALHVALGWPYRERRVDTGAVIYVACEGQAGVPQRIEAFKQTKLADKRNVNPPFYFLPTQLDLIRNVKKLVQEIRIELGDERPVMIVLDTLNRSLVGSESKDEDMSAYIAACEEIRQAFNCAVVIIHHCGVDGTRPRGHTSLTGAVDAQIAIRRQGVTIAKVEWMKDGEEGDEIISRLEKVVVGIDEDGENITSCVVVEETRIEFADKPMSPSKRAAMDILNKLIEASRTNDAAIDKWREGCINSILVSSATTRKGKAERFRVIYQELLDERIITIADDRVSIDNEL